MFSSAPSLASFCKVQTSPQGQGVVDQIHHARRHSAASQIHTVAGASGPLPCESPVSHATRPDQQASLSRTHQTDVQSHGSNTFGGTREAPSKPPSPLNMLRMEEGPEEGGPLAAGSAREAPGSCCAAGACLPGACQEVQLRPAPPPHPLA